MQHQEVVLVEALRSPIGRLGGQLANVRPDDLLAEVVRQVVARSGIDPTLIDQVYAGCANQAGEDNRNVARMSSLLADLPITVGGVTVNRLCASGLEAVVQGYRQIALSEAQCVVAGGVESMSRAPYVLAKASKAFPVGGLEAQDTCLGWRFKNPKLEAIFPLEAMGCTLRTSPTTIRSADATGWSRSCRRTRRSLPSTPAISSADRAHRGRLSKAHRDGRHRRGRGCGSSLEALSGLRAVRGGGSVTAGNASTLNDGASALMVCSRTFAEAHGLKVRATVRSVGSAGVDPTRMGIARPGEQQALARRLERQRP